MVAYVNLNRCLEYLLRNDANPGIRDKQGYNAVHYSAAYGHRLCLELVREHILDEKCASCSYRVWWRGQGIPPPWLSAGSLLFVSLCADKFKHLVFLK